MFKSIAEFEKNAQPLSPAEQDLIAACRKGERCTIGKGTLPPEGNKDKAIQIRASLLRVLILGGKPECGLHESGVVLFGAHITETLDLRFATGRGQVALESCRFDEKLRLENSRQAKLVLSGSALAKGMFADGMKVTGSVFLDNVISVGAISLAATDVRGQLVCNNAQFASDYKDAKSGKSMALRIQSAKVAGGILLRGIMAKGEVSLSSAEIGGPLECNGASFLKASIDTRSNPAKALNAQGAKLANNVFLSDVKAKGEVRLVGAQIGGQLICEGATFENGGKDKDGKPNIALNAQGMQVQGRFIFRKIKAVLGRVNLHTAHAHDLADDGPSWAKCRDLILDEFTYNRLTGTDSPRSYASRREWLKRGTADGEFRPQPYTQLAKVFRAAGDMGEARKVLMERDRLLFEHAIKPKREAIAAAHQANGQYPIDACLLYLAMRAWGWLTRVVVGYGHAPQRALGLACWASVIGFLWFMLAWRGGIIVPNSAVILTSADWLAAMCSNPAAPAHDWTQLPSGQHYETFYALAYALDVFVPLVSIGQESAWAATTADWFGWGTRIFTIAFQIAGWVITSLGIAAVTGFVQRGGPD